MIVAVLLLGFGGYFVKTSVAGSSEMDSRSLVIAGKWTEDAFGAWCQGTVGICCTISVWDDEVYIWPWLDNQDCSVSYIITQEQLEDLMAGKKITLPSSSVN